MRRLRRVCLAWQTRRQDPEAGTTMAEVLVGMGLMTVFLTMFTTAMVTMYHTSQRTETQTATSSQLNQAFTRLDKLIRYASAISTPSSTPNGAGNYYVEFQTSNTGTTNCTQLQLNTNTLKLSQRTWTVPSSGSYSNLTGFVPLASGVSANGTPFTLVANGAVDYEQLTFKLQGTLGSSPDGSESSVTFTALNSNSSSTLSRSNPAQPGTVCKEVSRP